MTTPMPWPYPTTTTAFLTGMQGIAYPRWVPPPATYSQYPTDLQDYSIDWSDWLASQDTIATSTWTVDSGTYLGPPAFNGAGTPNWVLVGGGLSGSGSLTAEVVYRDSYGWHTPPTLSGGGVLTAATSVRGLILSETWFTPTGTTVWVSGGIPGYLYEVRNTITTSAGRLSATRVLKFKIKQL